ncbi:MAG: DUF423 domain-containing protein [Alphaproteobacteria bacterium]
MKMWLLIGAINGFLAVGFGAFGAHGLEGKVADKDFAAFQTGAHYHLIHALALVGVAIIAHITQSGTANIAGWAFLVGIVLFSGSLYVLGITGSRALVIATPLGGISFLIGWAALAGVALNYSSQN